MQSYSIYQDFQQKADALSEVFRRRQMAIPVSMNPILVLRYE